MAMTPMPTPAPSRTMSQIEFDAAVALHVAALPVFISEANALQTDVNAKQATSSAAAVTATEQAVLATNNGAAQVTLAADQVALATTQAGLADADATATAADRVQTGLDSTAASDSATDSEASRIAASKLNLGNKAVEPTLDNQGAALLAGATYYDTALVKWRVWSGAAWVEGIASIAGVSSVNGIPGDVTVQVTLVSGTNIKTVNGATILGAGDINTLTGKTHTALSYTRDDDGTVSGGTWAIDYALGPVIKATAGANITAITMASWPATGTAGHLRLMLVNFGLYTVTFPAAWKWVKSDLTTTTTFADLSLTLPSAGTAIVDLFSDDGGTTLTATVLRG